VDEEPKAMIERSLNALDQALLFISAFLSAAVIGALSFLSVPAISRLSTEAPFVILSTILLYTWAT